MKTLEIFVPPIDSRAFLAAAAAGGECSRGRAAAAAPVCRDPHVTRRGDDCLDWISQYLAPTYCSTRFEYACVAFKDFQMFSRKP